jgi:hypothetical protein
MRTKATRKSIEESPIREIEISYRDGKAYAAYMPLAVADASSNARKRVYRSVPHEGGYVVDFTRAGVPLGIEVTAPATVTLARVNRLLASLGLAKVSRAVLRPLLAA